MNTLILPCAGKSSRFPGMKPKWLLTHPDGKLMIAKSLEGINIDIFDQVIITIVKEFDEKYEASLILKQVFPDEKYKICILDEFTSSVSETVFNTLKKCNIQGSIVIKDSDNYVKADIPKTITNFAVGYDLHKNNDVSDISSKSFLITDEFCNIKKIVEKQIISNTICIGVYAFENVEDFKISFLNLSSKNIKNELFISYIISDILSENKNFKYIEAKAYEDWGTLKQWHKTQKSHSTYFVDIDGVLMKNCGKYGSINWENNKEGITQNIESIIKLQNQGAQIVITTSRTEDQRAALEKFLEDNGIKAYSILMGLNHACRILINDFAPTNPYPSCKAITLPRNSFIKDYLL